MLSLDQLNHDKVTFSNRSTRATVPCVLVLVTVVIIGVVVLSFGCSFISWGKASFHCLITSRSSLLALSMGFFALEPPGLEVPLDDAPACRQNLEEKIQNIKHGNEHMEPFYQA